MFKARAPAFAEHPLQNADDFGGDVGFSRGVRKFERVKGDRELGVGGVEIDDVFDAAFGDEF